MAEDDPKSIKRFGVRYGRTTKLKYGQIERQYFKKQKCPFCHYVQIKRISAGIWHCQKCKSKFSGKAYSI